MIAFFPCLLSSGIDHILFLEFLFLRPCDL
jgi:hypothetical protein